MKETLRRFGVMLRRQVGEITSSLSLEVSAHCPDEVLEVLERDYPDWELIQGMEITAS